MVGFGLQGTTMLRQRVVGDGEVAAVLEDGILEWRTICCHGRAPSAATGTRVCGSFEEVIY
jgi:hypothetical protein